MAFSNRINETKSTRRGFIRKTVGTIAGMIGAPMLAKDRVPACDFIPVDSKDYSCSLVLGPFWGITNTGATATHSFSGLLPGTECKVYGLFGHDFRRAVASDEGRIQVTVGSDGVTV